MYTREESFYGLPRPLRADIQLWIHLVRTYIECNYFNFIAAIEKENFLLNKSPGTLPRLLFFVFLYPIAFYVIFSAFFEFVVLAVYVAARNFWYIAPFLSYYMCTKQSAVSGSPPNVVIYNMPNFLSKKTQMPLHITAAFKQRKEFFRRRIRLMYQEDFSSSSLIYSIPDFPVYANFCRIFYWQQKSAARRFFKYGNFFLLCSFLCTPGHMPWR